MADPTAVRALDRPAGPLGSGGVTRQLVGWLVATVMAGGAAVVQTLPAADVQLRPEAPHTVWPDSVTGWVTLGLGVGSVLAILYARFVATDIAQAKREMSAEVTGLGRRVEVVERGQVAQNEFNDRVIAHMSESATDRRNMNEHLRALSQTVHDLRKTHEESTRQLLDAILNGRGPRPR